jgi:hypothetical protein
MLKKKINFFRDQELLQVDFLQKYLLKDRNQIPQLKEINFSTNLNTLGSLNNASEEFLQNYSFFILYSTGCILPNIISSKNNSIIHSKKDLNLKLILKNRQDIALFLDNLFIHFLEKRVANSSKIIQTESSCSFRLEVAKNLDIQGVSNNPDYSINYCFKFDSKRIKKDFFFKKYAPFWAF